MRRLLSYLFGCSVHGHILHGAAVLSPVRCERGWRHSGPHIGEGYVLRMSLMDPDSPRVA